MQSACSRATPPESTGGVVASAPAKPVALVIHAGELDVPALAEQGLDPVDVRDEGLLDAARVADELKRRGRPLSDVVLIGVGPSAKIVARVALASTTPMRGVVLVDGEFEDGASEAKGQRLLLLSTHDDSPKVAQETRRFARALEQAHADVRSFHLADRDRAARPFFGGPRNEVSEAIAAFARHEPWPGGPEGARAVAEMWNVQLPRTMEGFWRDDALAVRRPVDDALRAQLRRIYGDVMRELEPWPGLTYDAIPLASYLSVHPELGRGDWVQVTNARDEQLVLSKKEIEEKKPLIVIGIDDERNLFRMFVTYNVYRTYSWKPETAARPLLVRNVGAFLHVPSGKGLDVSTFADFALTPESFRVVEKDPWQRAHAEKAPLAKTLTGEQGCLQCHALRGEGARAHHLRADDGKLAEAFGLPLEEYPPDVLSKFLFEQEAVAKTFGVGPLVVGPDAAKMLVASMPRR